jgi:seryl-tRNA synthetase
MWEVDDVEQALIERGDLWTRQPGLIGLRGPTLCLYRELEWRIADLARRASREEWRVPDAIGMETLARAEYFASFPHWLTSVSHMREKEEVLAQVATSPAPAESARHAQAPAAAALSPAVCYHVYESLADRVIDCSQLITVQGTCWRHEGANLRTLERGWAFTMREVVCVGSADAVAAFLRGVVDATLNLALDFGLTPKIEVATDPFFAPTSRGKELLQRMKGLKRELLLPAGSGRSVAAASFNDHETFFGEAFGIRLPDGSPAHSACLAFGIERWMLAFLCAHGTDPGAWPCGLVASLLESSALHLSLQEV